VEIRAAHTADEFAVAARLFRDHQQALGIDFCFQGFDEELVTLPGRYAEPEGGVWLASDGIGVVALRPCPEDGVCEMKRLYVADSARGTGLGRRLAERCVDEARTRDYATMRLDTLTSMDAANHIYRALGFRERSAYYDNPIPNVRYYELDLTSV